MPSSPNKLSQFWQELKRRNVVRVVTVYTGAAFVILSLVDMIREPFELPNWSFKLVVVILFIGLIISVILSWIYDIHPEGGVVKTEPADKTKPEEPLKTSKGWKIASYISFVVIVVLIILNAIPRTGKKEILDKSIAVMPFVNDSPNNESAYVLNGYMASVHDKLCTIKDLKVLARTSTDQYKNVSKPIREVASELHVGYLLTVSGQIYNNKIRLIVQLLDADENIIWSNPYDKQINDVDDHIDIQSEIAQLVAAKLQATITPDEKKRIEIIPTPNLTAYDFYLRGREEFIKNESFLQYAPNRFVDDDFNQEAFERAEYYFNEALKYDSTFAQAYTGLARIYWGIEGTLSEDYLDTVRVLLDKALLFDPYLAEAHTLYGRYYNNIPQRNIARAMREIDKAISLNPNDWDAYRAKAAISTDIIQTISNLQKAIQLNRGPELPNLLMSLGNSYYNVGFLDKASDIYEKLLKLTGDSIDYFTAMGFVEYNKRNFSRSLELLEQAAVDSTQLMPYMALFQYCLFLGDKEQALKYGKVWVEGINATGREYPNAMHRVGSYYELQGLEKEAEYYYDLQIEICLQQIEVRRGGNYYDLASAYAVKGEVEKALENLRIWMTHQSTINMTMLGYLRMDSNFNSIRYHPEFQKILNEAETSFQAEHERVRQWLEESDML